MGGVRGQGRRGAAGEVRLPRVVEGQGESWRWSPGRAQGAAGQELPQGALEVPHEQRVDDGVHRAVAVAQPGDGVEEGEGDALAHCLSEDGEKRITDYDNYRDRSKNVLQVFDTRSDLCSVCCTPCGALGTYQYTLQTGKKYFNNNNMTVLEMFYH